MQFQEPDLNLFWRSCLGSDWMTSPKFISRVFDVKFCLYDPFELFRVPLLLADATDENLSRD